MQQNYIDNAKNDDKTTLKTIDSLDLKKGPFSIAMNIIGAVLTLGVIVSVFFIFPVPALFSEAFLSWLWQILGACLVVLICLILSFFIKILILLPSKPGKIRLHFGLLVEVYAEKPVKRSAYFLSDFLSGLIVLVALGITLCFIQNLFTYIAFAMYAVAFLTNIPLFVFQLRQPSDSYLKLEKGQLLVLAVSQENKDA